MKLIIILLGVALASGCNSTQKVTNDTSETTPTEVNEATEATEAEIEETMTAENTNKSEQLYRLNVSFISIGSGKDYDALKSFNTFLKEEHPGLKYETAAWGREGEVDYCFLLDKMTPKQQLSFIADVKELLAESTLIRYRENDICRNLK